MRGVGQIYEAIVETMNHDMLREDIAECARIEVRQQRRAEERRLRKLILREAAISARLAR